jgi:hypothetical protein
MASPLDAGDIVTIVTLIKNVYSDYKDAGENYKHITSQLQTLMFIVKDIDELIKTHKTQISPQKELEMRAIVGYCANVVRTLKTNLATYKSLGTGPARKRDVVLFLREDIVRISGKLQSCTIQIQAVHGVALR